MIIHCHFFTYFHISSSLDGNGGGGVDSDGRYQTMDDGWIKYLTMDDHIPNDGRSYTKRWTIIYQTMDDHIPNDGPDQTMDQIKRWTRPNDGRWMDQILNDGRSYTKR
ncbi:hypothetical protein RDWZM_004146 [Blomia tropicalis]|uniref:Uncharacterized protein n=1 Tax=Blomia tropicalis TaxID=40697 RepID=A0A9Q0MGN5_BLOTA|nr:hypothetical protein RDWZM_004146 [Blomia tropicalis]